jgi:riboflavin biosynthesis pyrimidine reductase
VRMIFPSAGDELNDFGVAEVYAYPRETWLRANFVTSADGAAYVEGRSGGLSSPGDMRLFGILRVLADVVLVGAGTARTEEYKPARRRDALARLREGRPPTPPIALVTGSLELDLAAPLFTEAPPDARTIVITSGASPAGRRAEVAKVADVIVAGETEVDLAEAVGELAKRGLARVICEGGPHLFGSLAAAGLLDELSLTVSPILAGPGAGRIIAGPELPAARMTLATVLAEDGFLFCRYTAKTGSARALCSGADGGQARGRHRGQQPLVVAHERDRGAGDLGGQHLGSREMDRVEGPERGVRV